MKKKKKKNKKKQNVDLVSSLSHKGQSGDFDDNFLFCFVFVFFLLVPSRSAILQSGFELKTNNKLNEEIV